ncbi:MAG: peptide deformylase [Gammaproteobacteria bacterium]|nr:peptide deformylase [Gammaproteobacteria bacterium]
MSVREILQIGHPILSAPAKKVEIDKIATPEVQSWIDDMIDTMRDANGAGIAANQIGIPYRLFIIEVGNNPRYPYKPTVPLTIVINPVIEFLTDETFASNEGCLSVPQMRATVDRHVEIRASYYDRDGIHQSQEIRGYSACTWQHEHDHLDGILFPNRVTDMQSFCSWSVFQQYQQPAFAKMVLELVQKWGA